MLQNLCLLPNRHLLIEGGLLDQVVEVYEMQSDAGIVSEPIHVIETGARGLSAIDFSNERIYMGFQGASDDVRSVIQVYDTEYNLLTKIFVGEESYSFSDMTLCRENNFLVTNIISGESQNFITVVNIEEESVEMIEPPFGQVECVWAIEKFETYAEGEPQTIFLPTTGGLFICVLHDTGDFAYCMESYYDGINVTNAVVINEDELLISTLNEGQNKLVILNLETKEERIVIAPEAAVQVLDIT